MKLGLNGTTQNVDSRVRYHFQLIQSPKPVSEEESQNEVVVESGPVEYEKNDENTQEYDDHELEEEEEEGEPVSVAQLMGHIYDGGKLLPFFSVRRVLRSEHTRRQVAVTRLGNRSLLCTGRAISCSVTLRRHVATTSSCVLEFCRCLKSQRLVGAAEFSVVFSIASNPCYSLWSLPVTPVTRYGA